MQSADKHAQILKDKTETTCLKCFWFVPRLPKSSVFRRWLPKHRHILFGHFGYWIFVCLISATSGYSLKTKCRETEAVLIFITLIIVSVAVSFPKLLAGEVKRMFGPAILSFLTMFSTALSLHQKPLICGFPTSRNRISRQTANIWGVVVSLQVIVMLFTMLLYLFWHLKHKDEKRMAALEVDGESDAESDEDSLQGSLASVKWTTASRDDLELSQ